MPNGDEAMEGMELMAPLKRGAETVWLHVQVIDATDPALFTVRTREGAVFKVGRKRVKGLDQ